MRFMPSCPAGCCPRDGRRRAFHSKASRQVLLAHSRGSPVALPCKHLHELCSVCLACGGQHCARCISLPFPPPLLLSLIMPHQGVHMCLPRETVRAQAVWHLSALCRRHRRWLQAVRRDSTLEHDGCRASTPLCCFYVKFTMCAWPQVCGASGENMLCLQCHTVLCGRHSRIAAAHMHMSNVGYQKQSFGIRRCCS